MSQQKMCLVAVCLLGAIAFASAQNFDYNACSRGIQKEIDRYRETLVAASQRFTQSLQQTGSEAVDLEPFQQDIEKLTQSLSQMANIANGFDVSRFMSIYLENLSTISSMMRNSFRLSLISGTLENYIEFGNSIYGANTKFLQKVTDSCMPNRMRRVQPTV